MDARVYRGARPDAMLIVPLDDLTAIYHRPSGQTHLVIPPAPEILSVLGETPLTLDALMAALGAAFDLADADPTALRARLDELVAAGLVEEPRAA